MGLAVLVPTAWNQTEKDPCEEVTCQPCAIFCKYEAVLGQTQVEVGAIRGGMVVHYHSGDPLKIVDLQRFAFEKQKLHAGADDAKTLAEFCEKCRRKSERIQGARYEVANSAHGVFVVLTSDDEEIVDALHAMAAEMALRNDVRGS